MEKLSYPSDVYFRIVKAGASGELRVDLYKALDGDYMQLHHVMEDGSFFLREIGDKLSERDKLEEEKLLNQPISALIKKINEITKDKNINL
ncbi:MAG: hypothetical protein ABIH63_04735 [archaeon]